LLQGHVTPTGRELLPFAGRLQRGRIISTPQNPQDALDRYTRFLDSDPANLQLLARAIDLCIDLGDTERGLQWAARALALSPGDPYFLYRKGCLQMSASRLDEAEQAFREAVERSDEPAPRAKLGHVLLLLGKYPEAKDVLAQALSQTERAPEVAAEVAALYLRALHYLGEVQEAIGFGEQQLEKVPGQPTLLAMLSTLYTDSGDLGKAKEAAQKSLAMTDRAPEALVTLGTAALNDQETEQAADYFRRALEQSPKSGRAWVGQGLASMLALDLDGAEKSLKAGVQNMPTHVGSWHALAWCQILKKDAAAAEASLTKALELDRNFAETHGGLAVVALMQGDTEKAKTSIRRALGLDTQCFSARFAQSLLLSHGGREDAARQLVQGILGSMHTADGRSLLTVLSRFPARKPDKLH
jgi:tetratricopeptide (TPR) repeat protein